MADLVCFKLCICILGDDSKKEAALFKLFLLIVLFPVNLQWNDEAKQLIVWNVGQGQWVTIVNGNQCLHFDTGGEFFPIKQIDQKCKKRENIIFLSHGDWDHINGLRYFKKNNSSYCLNNLPEENLSLKKTKLLKNQQRCKSFHSLLLFSINPSIHCKSQRSTNCFSRIFEWDKRILIPGDSPSFLEKIWASKISDQIQILLLGHHGSSTSTSNYLLQTLSRINLAISSSRKKKYGHPSMRVQNSLKQHYIPLLTTEEWGTLIIEL